MTSITTEHAVLVFTDLVDSVKLQQSVGAVVYARLKAFHDQCFRNAIDQCPGAKIIESTGDGFYARFPTSSGAVQACLRFQHSLSTQNVEGYTLKARVGIHNGEVLHDASVSNQLLGMAPNITARVMSLALPGQILVTEPVFHDAQQYVLDHPPVADQGKPITLRWLNHGEYRLKGETLPVKIFEVGAVNVAPLRMPPSSEKAKRVIQAFGATADSLSEGQQAPRSRNLILAIAVASILLGTIWVISTRRTDPQGEGLQSLTARNEENLSAPPASIPSAAGKNTELDPQAQILSKDPEPSENEESKEVVSVTRNSVQEKASAKVSQIPISIVLDRLKCVSTHNISGEDFVIVDIKADEQPVEVKYLTNYRGTPCTSLKAEEEWSLEIEVTFEEEVVVNFQEIGGLRNRLGRVIIRPETIAQGFFSTDLVSSGFGMNHYRFEWRLSD